MFQSVCEPVTLFGVTLHDSFPEKPPRIAFDPEKFRTPSELEIEVALCICEEILESGYLESLPFCVTNKHKYKQL